MKLHEITLPAKGIHQNWEAFPKEHQSGEIIKLGEKQPYPGDHRLSILSIGHRDIGHNLDS